MYKFCENSILKENYGAVWKEYSTVDHIYILKYAVELFCFIKWNLFWSFIDYGKAFDMVRREACVILLKECFISLTGVRQGENLLPSLFA